MTEKRERDTPWDYEQKRLTTVHIEPEPKPDVLPELPKKPEKDR